MQLFLSFYIYNRFIKNIYCIFLHILVCDSYMKKSAKYFLSLLLTMAVTVTLSSCKNDESSSSSNILSSTVDNSSYAPKDYSGEGRPNDAFGNEGDTYTDTSNGNVYVKQNGTWVLISEGQPEEEHTVVFDLNGGQMPDGSISEPTQKVKNGGWVKKPTYDPIKRNSKIYICWLLLF